MDNINWGIIGCGNVTEKKSGQAYNKIHNSKLVAVMRRNAAKAADYAARHHVDRWYDAIYASRPSVTRCTQSCARRSRSPPVAEPRSARTRACIGTRRRPRSRSCMQPVFGP